LERFVTRAEEILLHNRKEIRGISRKLRDEKLHKLYTSFFTKHQQNDKIKGDAMGGISSMRRRYKYHIHNRSQNKIKIRALWRNRRKWEDNIKMYLRYDA